MGTLCPNLDREDGLEIVLEVSIPEEMFTSPKHRTRQNMKYHNDNKSTASIFGSRNAEIQLLLGMVGAPLIPHPIRSQHSFNTKINDRPIEASMAKYIVQQYIVAAGGERALNSMDSMYSMRKIKMVASEFTAADGMGLNKGNVMKIKSVKNESGEMGEFVLWQKRPDLWSMSWWFQGVKSVLEVMGLDPEAVANLFSSSICIGEMTVNEEDCFVLKLEAEPSTLKARSSSKVEVMRHTACGYFSQRTGLLFQLQDTHLLRIKAPGNDVFWETTMESLILDYRTIDGVNFAHAGRTSVSLFRFGENSEGHTRTRMEEVWTIEEVDFNRKGLSAGCFLPPSDLMKEDEVGNDANKKLRLGFKTPKLKTSRRGVSKIMSIDEEDLEDYEADEES
ncbi:hypothetical protein CQW23_07020 [Capsicum baccatum]|uniref:Uncharacterized protein n=1 Tax=Capsicum baccatum TaxID=33114 RepID=A0A2G2X4Z4_CAPBA|nr:hypothetical protein CQW23_07020 [Capsicum baccatum]